MLEALVALHDSEALQAFLPEAERIRHAVAVLGPASDRASGLLRLWEGDTVGARASLERALAEALPVNKRAMVLDAALRQYKQLGATPSAERLRSAGVSSGV